jgi:RNA-directed DNA polymerase
VQAALKLVLEPIFEAGFLPVSYGFRPKRRAHDAIAEIHHFGTRGYRWVLDADIEACFDSISHSALMDRVRARVKDKRVLALVKAFLKAGILTELGDRQDTHTGTPQGGILSPLLANIALSALDEHVMEPWKPGGAMSTLGKRSYRRSKGRPTWRIIRYADDFVILVHGSREDTEALREDVAVMLAPLGLRLSAAKTQVVHMGDGFDFLGFRIRWKRKRGVEQVVRLHLHRRPTGPVVEGEDPCPDTQDIASASGVCANPLGDAHAWVGQLLQTCCGEVDLQQAGRFHLVEADPDAADTPPLELGSAPRHLATAEGRWQIAADGVEFFRIEGVTVSRYAYRGNKIPTPWPTTNPA